MPSYISVKGRPLVESDPIDWQGANTVVGVGDTFEVEIDPNNYSLFSIYNHINPDTHNPVNPNTGKRSNQRPEV